jgi:hypothetical protein
MAPPGNQAVNGENKHQPAVSGETALQNFNIQSEIGVTDELCGWNNDYHPG